MLTMLNCSSCKCEDEEIVFTKIDNECLCHGCLEEHNYFCECIECGYQSYDDTKFINVENRFKEYQICKHCNYYA